MLLDRKPTQNNNYLHLFWQEIVHGPRLNIHRHGTWIDLHLAY